MKRGSWVIFHWPLLLTLPGFFGLFSALLGDDLYGLLSQSALGTLLVLVGRAQLRLPQTRRNP